MKASAHWDRIYQTKAHDAVSWYRPHLEKSVALIEEAAGQRSAAIIDVGGGESTLVDDLVARGYRDITVLDISQTAINVAKKPLGRAAEQVHWLIADIAHVDLLPQH